MDIKMKSRWDKLSTDFSAIQKIVIAPQIVVYKNMFKHSKEIIDLLNKNLYPSYFGEWKDWYSQGLRRGAYPKDFYLVDNNKEEYLSEELSYIAEVNECMNFIRKDYLNDFGKDSGIWPSFIDDWDSLYNNNNEYYIDFFRYEIEKEMKVHDTGLIMQYHVDEVPVPGERKSERHVATVNFYLNDDYEGGEICVYDSVSNKSYMYKPLPGDAVIMPSTEPFYHGVRPFKKHDRYFLRAFIDTKVVSDIEWTKKYEINIPTSMIDLITTQEEYIEKDLQTIKLSIPPELIEIKG
jgi:hypothetical protein